MPSIWYENFPRTLVEAFACGLPVVASRIGALEDLIVHGKTGLLVDVNSADSLVSALRWVEANPAPMAEMGRAARREYQQRYTGETNVKQLTAIYREAIRAKAGLAVGSAASAL